MKVYFDRTLIVNEYLSFLAPLLGKPDFTIRVEEDQQISERYEAGKSVLSFADKDTCDYFVYPKYFLLDHFSQLHAYAKDAQQHGKKVIVFTYGEIEDYINAGDNVIWFKRSTHKNNPSNEYCLPAFPEDLIKYNDHQVPLSWVSSIGFTGYSDYYDLRSFLYFAATRLIGVIARVPFVKWILFQLRSDKRYGRLVNAWTGSSYRWKAIKQLQKLTGYTFHFVQRKHAIQWNSSNRFREEYIENMINSDFALAVRGYANYSIRLYEIMSLGKIPLYIDTGAKLPFEDQIDYKKLFIIVPGNDMKHMERYINTYIARHGHEIASIQQQIRETYEQYFTIKNYHLKVIALLENLLFTP